MITICLTYFKSLALANLRAALYSVRRQDLSFVQSLVIVDNDTTDSMEDIRAVINEFEFPLYMGICFWSYKHGDQSRTQSWSANMALRNVMTPWAFFTRADYVLDFNIVARFMKVLEEKGPEWNGFITSHGYHLNADVDVCEGVPWRTAGASVLRNLSGAEVDYTSIDSGVWMTRRKAFDVVGGFDESLTAWGHAQTLFQYKMHRSGVEFVRIPEVLFYHPMHAGQRDLELAHRQLRDIGVDLRELWARHNGVQPYGRK